MDGLSRLNRLSLPSAREELRRCCGSSRWAAAMAGRRPFNDEEQLYRTARDLWRGLGREDWLEAFSSHPRIGEKSAPAEKFAATKTWSSGEQAGVAEAPKDVLEGLANGHIDYERKFGYIFIVCASGKSAGEMLVLLRRRLENEPAEELIVAAEEQEKITRLRLEKWLKT